MVTLHVPQHRVMGVLQAKKEESAMDAATLIREALSHPIGSGCLRDLAYGKQRILVITSDHTRPLPSRVTLPLLLEEIRRGAEHAEIRILVATGMHRAPTTDELREKYGEEMLRREQFFIHRCDQEEGLRYFGQLPSGGELWLNAMADWAQLVVAEGLIEPHFFAGFSGGRKSILPGIAGRKTVLYNHNACMIGDLRAAAGCLMDNPIHQDMTAAARLAHLAFILNVLIDDEKRIVAAFAGDPELAHLAGSRVCKDKMSVPAAQADIVVTSNGGYPLDQNMYQCVKGMTAGEACVKQGGIIILCAALGDGHGGEAFFRYFSNGLPAEDVENEILAVPPDQTQPDQWQAQILARVLKKARCIFVSGPENRELIERMGMAWAETPDCALNLAEQMLGCENASVCLIPDGVGILIGNK